MHGGHLGDVLGARKVLKLDGDVGVRLHELGHLHLVELVLLLSDAGMEANGHRLLGRRRRALDHHRLLDDLFDLDRLLDDLLDDLGLASRQHAAGRHSDDGLAQELPAAVLPRHVS